MAWGGNGDSTESWETCSRHLRPPNPQPCHPGHHPLLTEAAGETLLLPGATGRGQSRTHSTGGPKAPGCSPSWVLMPIPSSRSWKDRDTLASL